MTYKLSQSINHSRCNGCGNTMGIHPNNPILKHFLRKIKKIEEGKIENISNAKIIRQNKKMIEYRKIIAGLHRKIEELKNGN